MKLSSLLVVGIVGSLAYKLYDRDQTDYAIIPEGGFIPYGYPPDFGEYFTAWNTANPNEGLSFETWFRTRYLVWLKPVDRSDLHYALFETYRSDGGLYSYYKWLEAIKYSGARDVTRA